MHEAELPDGLPEAVAQAVQRRHGRVEQITLPASRNVAGGLVGDIARVGEQINQPGEVTLLRRHRFPVGGQDREQIIGGGLLSNPVHEALKQLLVGGGVSEDRPAHVEYLRQRQGLLALVQVVADRVRQRLNQHVDHLRHHHELLVHHVTAGAPLWKLLEGPHQGLAASCRPGERAVLGLSLGGRELRSNLVDDGRRQLIGQVDSRHREHRLVRVEQVLARVRRLVGVDNGVWAAGQVHLLSMPAWGDRREDHRPGADQLSSGTQSPAARPISTTFIVGWSGDDGAL